MYPVNETFLSIQGEGARAGSLNVFVRFAGCNLTCRRDGEAGFDCDTEFTSSVSMSTADILQRIRALWPTTANSRPNVILTGGEPLLHLDDQLVEALLGGGMGVIAIETNGTQSLPANAGDFWVSCSPKSAEHTLRIMQCEEVRYVRNAGQGIPRPAIRSTYKFVSPAWHHDPKVTRANLQHCIQLIHEHPEWRLSTQQHKLWALR